MSKRLDVFLQRDATTVGWNSPLGYQTQTLPADSSAFAHAFTESRTGHKLVGADVDLYLGEDLLFFTKITLPLQTPDIKKAIALQLEMLSPFGEDSLAAFAAQRTKEGYSVNIYFCRRSQVTPFLDILFAAGTHLTGLFPESQRYLTRDTMDLSWSLWNPGRFGKVTHFMQGKVINRDLCASPVSVAQLKEQSGSDTLYSLGSVEEGVSSALALLTQPARGREYDMLPPSFRRPDYIKKAMMALAAVNVILILLLGVGKGLALYRQEAFLDQQIEATKIDAEAALQLKSRIKKIEKQLDAYRAMGTNTDLIAFLAKLSKELPATAYLDQLRFDHPMGTITLQGYTNDLPGLTEKIPTLGSATLKSTMKRRNQTYFHLEVSMP